MEDNTYVLYTIYLSATDYTVQTSFSKVQKFLDNVFQYFNFYLTKLFIQIPHDTSTILWLLL